METSAEKVELNEINKEHLQELRNVIIEHKIEYAEESIDFVLSKLNISFEDTAEYSDENLKVLFICGLPSHDRKEALNIISMLRKDGISYREQHQLLVTILKEDHFFMDGDNMMNLLNLIDVIQNQ